MMDEDKEKYRQEAIIPKAMLVAIKGRKLLIHKILSTPGSKNMVRLPGGHIEFGEYSKETIVRETKEELGMKLYNPKLLGVLENIFKDEEKSMHHEIVFMYTGRLEKRAYEKEVIQAREGKMKFEMQWVSIDDIIKGKRILVPKGSLKFVKEAERL